MYIEAALTCSITQTLQSVMDTLLHTMFSFQRLSLQGAKVFISDSFVPCTVWQVKLSVAFPIYLKPSPLSKVQPSPTSYFGGSRNRSFSGQSRHHHPAADRTDCSFDGCPTAYTGHDHGSRCWRNWRLSKDPFWPQTACCELLPAMPSLNGQHSVRQIE